SERREYATCRSHTLVSRYTKLKPYKPWTNYVFSGILLNKQASDVPHCPPSLHPQIFLPFSPSVLSPHTFTSKEKQRYGSCILSWRNCRFSGRRSISAWEKRI